jgi:hypothetical protein
MAGEPQNAKNPETTLRPRAFVSKRSSIRLPAYLGRLPTKEKKKVQKDIESASHGGIIAEESGKSNEELAILTRPIAEHQ